MSIVKEPWDYGIDESHDLGNFNIKECQNIEQNFDLFWIVWSSGVTITRSYIAARRIFVKFESMIDSLTNTNPETGLSVSILHDKK